MRTSLLLATLLLGCADLGSISEGVCGNGIVEAGEDCDTPSSSCGAPTSSSAACRFVCEAETDCPKGHHCGLDGICRTPTGAFAQIPSVASDGLSQVGKGDMDGDGLDDLISLAQDGHLTVSYMSGDGVEGTASFRSTPFPFAVAQMTVDDSRADIVHAPNTQIGVLRGASDRTLEPTAYSPIPVSEAEALFLVVEGREPANPDELGFYGGQEILEFANGQIMTTAPPEVLFAVPYSTSDFIDRAISTGDLDTRPQSKCDEFVLSRQGEDHVAVYTACAGNGSEWNHNPNALPSVLMPSGVNTGGGELIVDVDGDGNLDLVILSDYYVDPKDPSQPTNDLYVAFGTGDGQFHDGVGQPGVARLLMSGVSSAPLAAGDLNQDGVADFVFSDEVALSGDCSTLSNCWAPATLEPEAPWFRVAIADFNDNGELDIASISYGARSITFWNGAGGGDFNVYQIPTQGFPEQLAIGDFDGDLATDIAINENSDQSGEFSADAPARHDSLSIAFGNLQGAPSSPVSMGRLGRIEAIAAGQFWFQGPPDAVSDLGVLTGDDTTGQRSVALFTGATNRQLQSPFLLTNEDGSADVALGVSVGNFVGEAHPDVSALAIHPDVASLSLHVRLWSLESTGEAELAQATAHASGDWLDQLDVDACSLLMVPVTFQGESVEDLVLLGRPKGQGDGGRILIAKDGSSGWKVSDPIVVEQSFQNSYQARFTCRTALTNSPDFSDDEASQVQVTDLDGDSMQELVTLTRTVNYEHRLSVFPIGTSIGSNVFDLAIPGGLDPIAFAAFQADSDPAQEIVLATSSAVYLAQVDLPNHTLVSPVRLAGSDEVAVPAGGPEPPPSPGPGQILFGIGRGVVSGDFDGDRLTDFAVGHDGVFNVFLSVPLRK